MPIEYEPIGVKKKINDEEVVVGTPRSNQQPQEYEVGGKKVIDYQEPDFTPAQKPPKKEVGNDYMGDPNEKGTGVDRPEQIVPADDDDSDE